ncbi:MAG: DUF4328 domain-containing protein [Actinomycetota bacterium]
MIADVRPLRGLAAAVVFLLSVQVALLGIRVLTLFNRIRVAGRIDRHEWVSQAAANAADAWVRGAAGLWLLVFVATVIVWCVWQHRAQQAAHALVTGMETSAAWAVGCWFVPFVNYVKPFQAMRELWRASEGTPSWQRQPTWPVLGWWWATWLGFNALGWLQGTTLGADLDAIRRSDIVGLLSVILGVVAAILAIQIVRQVSTRLGAATVIAIALPADAPASWRTGDGFPHPPGPPLPPPPAR